MRVRLIMALALICFTSIVFAQEAIFEIAEFDYPEDGYFSGQFSFYNQHFRSIRGADINGDGYDDYLRSIRDITTGYYHIAAYWGCEDPSGIPDQTYCHEEYGLTCVQPSWYGDLNGDGRNDLLITYRSGNEVTAVITIQDGDFSVEPTMTFDVNYPGGCRVWNGGLDFNDDGFDDVIIADYDSPAHSMGNFDVIYGGQNMDTIVDVHFEGSEELYPALGRYDSIGDINGDGIVDLILTHQDSNNDPIYFNIYLGGSDFDNIPEITFHPADMDAFHSCLIANGDLNGDGCDDIVYSMLNTVYVYWGDPDIDMSYSTFEIENTNSSLPYSYFFYCDINNDGYDDLGLRRYFEDTVDFYLGNAYVPDGVSYSVDVAYHCACEGMGQDIGDINGDGADDVLVTNGGSQHHATVYTIYPTVEESVGISIDSVVAGFGETIEVPIRISIPADINLNAIELAIEGFEGLVDQIGVSFTGSMIEDQDWLCVWNNTGGSLLIAAAGTNAIEGDGLLATMVVTTATQTDPYFIPLDVTACTLNDGSINADISGGGVIVGLTTGYGDIDMNGLVQAWDSSLILQFLVGEADLTPIQLIVADVSLDNTVSALDATLILQYLVGIIDELPYPVDPEDFPGRGEVEGSVVNNWGYLDASVPFHFTNVENVVGFEMRFRYDPEILEFQDAVLPDEISLSGLSINEADGVISIAGTSAEAINMDQMDIDLNFRCELVSNNPSFITMQSLRWNEMDTVVDAAESEIRFTLDSPVDPDNTPSMTQLTGLYPNPFNPRTTVSFDLVTTQKVSLQVFNTKGQLIRTLVDGQVQQGSHTIEWNGKDSTGKSAASGIYLFKLKAGACTEIAKALLLK